MKRIYTIDDAEELKVKEYINNYIKELQRHFDVPDKRMRAIIYSVYKDSVPVSFMKNLIYMLKSEYEKLRLKRKYR